MGEYRVDTIEWLETIGGDASLRYAAADELKGVLERARADAGFVKAVTTGDNVLLRSALGIPEEQHVVQSNAPGHGDEEDEDEGEDEGEEGGEPVPPRR
jgi:hypothetical protein